MIRNSLLTATAVLLAACASQSPASHEEAQGAANIVASPAVAGPAERAWGASAGKPVAFKEGTDEDSWSFGYSWPAQANAIAPLDAILRARKDKVRAERRGYWEEAQTECPPDAASCMNHYYEEHWAVVTDLAQWLSLSSTVETYSGGAHGNQGFDALLWDKRAEKMREATELFQSERAFSDAVRADFCKALDKERAKRRDNSGVEGFDDCFDPTDAVIILGSSNAKAFDRIGFLIAPYLAGPYVEGDYEVTLPITAMLLSKVKAEFRDSFVVAK